jgi:hypothetical protein
MMVPSRAIPRFVPTEKMKLPLPEPETPPDCKLIQVGESVVAVHSHPDGAETETIVDPPPDVKSRVSGVNVKLHGPVTVSTVVRTVVPSVAVMVAKVVLVVAVVVAVKLALVDPAGITTGVGTETTDELAPIVTETPPEGAALLRVKLHALDDPPATLVGLQETISVGVY